MKPFPGMGTSRPSLDAYLPQGSASFGVAAAKFSQALIDMQQLFAKALIHDAALIHYITADDIDPPKKESK